MHKKTGSVKKYQLKKPLKTRVLNFFRKGFKIPFIEHWLVKKLEKNSDSIYAKLVPPNYLYAAGSIRKVERFGLKYRVDISNVVDHYLYYSVKDVSFNNFIENYIKPGYVVLDIGANIGTTITRLARKLGSKGYVIGFEPGRSNYQRAVEHIQMNELNNCSIENLGLGDKQGSFKLFSVNMKNPGMNRILTNGEAEAYPYEEVQVITLDDYCRSKNISQVNAVKMDVEGFEYFVLKGGLKVISQHQPTILMELNNKFLNEHNLSVNDIFNLLSGCGYQRFIKADTGEAISPESFAKGIHTDIICTA